jgi:AcrR family transcriptional regulator
MVYRTTAKMAQRKKAHRTKLLETAVQFFGKHGYQATTVPMIAKASGSSTGSFYFYFRNKEDVFATALERLGERIAEALNAAITVAGENPLQQMRAGNSTTKAPKAARGLQSVDGGRRMMVSAPRSYKGIATLS